MRKRFRQKRIIDASNYKERFSPRKAFLYSIFIPGAGQVYNKRYWKLPIVYGGLAGGIYLIFFHHTRYALFKTELYKILESGVSKSPSLGLTEAQIRPVIERSRRDRDIFLSLTILWYIFQAVEAHVDAHLKFFSVAPNLEVKIVPTMYGNPANSGNVGIGLQMHF